MICLVVHMRASVWAGHTMLQYGLSEIILQKIFVFNKALIQDKCV